MSIIATGLIYLGCFLFGGALTWVGTTR